MIGVGIVGMGSSLPSVRTNDWWPESVTRGWAEMRLQQALRGRDAPGDLDTVGSRLVKACMAAAESEPFFGIVERRALGPTETTLTHEIRAAEAALLEAGRTAADIDFVLVHSTLPRWLMIGNGPAFHAELGLAADVQVVQVDAVFNSFQAQLDLARMMIASGEHRHGLLVQSSGMTKLIPREDPTSTLFGDGATAQVVSEVSAGRGVLAMAHVTDGSVYGAAVLGNARRDWWEDGALSFHIADGARARKMFLGAADFASSQVERALAKAGLATSDVAFFAGHQATSWFSRMTQKACGLDGAKSVVTFPYFGNMGSSNLPLVLDIGRKEGLLRDGDVVAMLAGGSGQNVTGSVIRWGK